MKASTYIAAEMTKPFEPGNTDCANSADRWFYLKRGFSAMATFGRHVTSREELDAWLAEPGGLIRGMCAVMERAGCERTTIPEAGDIGIVVVDNRACIAIYDIGGWWSRDDDGFIIAADTEHRYIAWRI